MDNAEQDFMLDFAKKMSNITGTTTDALNSRYGPQGMSQELKQRLIREGKLNRGTVIGGNHHMTVPEIPDENMQLTPMEITPDMIKEIQDYGEDTLLPEYSKMNKGIQGNPSQTVTAADSVNGAGNVCVDNNQLELNFDKITVDHVYEQYGEMSKLLNKCLKELQIIKGLVETHINN